MTAAEVKTRRDEIANLLAGHQVDIERGKAAAVIYLADTLRPLVEAFVEATKIGGAFGPVGARR